MGLEPAVTRGYANSNQLDHAVEMSVDNGLLTWLNHDRRADVLHQGRPAEPVASAQLCTVINLDGPKCTLGQNEDVTSLLERITGIGRAEFVHWQRRWAEPTERVEPEVGHLDPGLRHRRSAAVIRLVPAFELLLDRV